jgi:hypothetical protein
MTIVIRIECHYAEGHIFLIVKLSAVMLNVIMLNVVLPFDQHVSDTEHNSIE